MANVTRGPVIRPTEMDVVSTSKGKMAGLVVAYTLLNTIPGLERLVNLLSGGRCNTVTLAQSILHRSIAIAVMHPAVQQKLGEHAGLAVHLVSEKLIYGRAVEHAQVADLLAQLGHSHVMHDGSEAEGFWWSASQPLRAHVCAVALRRETGGALDKASQLINAIVEGKDQWRAIDQRIDAAVHGTTSLPGMPNRILSGVQALLASGVKSLLHKTVEHNIRQRSADNAPASPASLALAERLNADIRRGQMADFIPYRDFFAPQASGLLSAASIVSSPPLLQAHLKDQVERAIALPHQVIGHMRQTLDEQLEHAGFPTQSRPLAHYFDDVPKIDLTAPVLLADGATDRDIAEARLRLLAQSKRFMTEQEKSEVTGSVLKDIDFKTLFNLPVSGDPSASREQGGVVSEALQALLTVPDNERSAVNMLCTPTGQLCKIHSYTSFPLSAGEQRSAAIEGAMSRPPEETVKHNGLTLGTGFLNSVDTLDMSVNAPAKSIVSAVMGWLSSAQQYFQPPVALTQTHPRIAELQSVCGADNELLGAVTHYLDAEWVQNLLTPAMDFQRQGKDTFCQIGRQRARIDMDAVRTRFQIGPAPASADGTDSLSQNGVMIGVETLWPVHSTPDAGSEAGVRSETTVSQNCILIVRRNEKQQIVVYCYADDARASIDRRLAFDHVGAIRRDHDVADADADAATLA